MKQSISASSSLSLGEELRQGWLHRLQLLFGGSPLKVAPSPKIIHRKGIDQKPKQVCPYPPPEEQIMRVKKRCRKKQKCILTRNLHAGGFDLLARSLLKPSEYFTLLSIPNIRCFNKPKKKHGHRCIKDPQCSYRIENLARPKLSYVLATWKDHKRSLKPDFKIRLNDLLHSHRYSVGQTRCFFKHYDRMKRKKERKALKERMKMQPQLSVLEQWTDEQISQTARVIVEYVLGQPVPNLAFKHFLISSFLMTHISNTGVLEEPLTRDAVEPYERTMVEICDKLAVWINKIIAILEIQSVDDTVYPPDIVDWGEEGEGEEYFGPIHHYGEEYGGEEG